MGLRQWGWVPMAEAASLSMQFQARGTRPPHADPHWFELASVRMPARWSERGLLAKAPLIPSAPRSLFAPVVDKFGSTGYSTVRCSKKRRVRSELGHSRALPPCNSNVRFSSISRHCARAFGTRENLIGALRGYACGRACFPAPERAADLLDCIR